MPHFPQNSRVKHPRFGLGHVRYDDGDTVLVRFDHGVEECLARDLALQESVQERAALANLDPPAPVVAKALAACITSVNDTWGVFAASRIKLLPHQLWVCKRVLETWPTRWLIADDVGLGKTIEAGLILTPLLASGRATRVLILAPSSLVAQWQERMREMFDLRMTLYTVAADTPRSAFWSSHDQVIASLHTLRKDQRGRWRRLAEAKPWDLVLVDEAHHLNREERDGGTLAFKLVQHLQELDRIHSLLFFTGTPHRGKDYGFLSLLQLLRPRDFDPEASLESQLSRLRNVMIRNNKRSVTDLDGRPLFTPVTTTRETYTYTPAEADFYLELTEFIVTGKAYAAKLSLRERSMVMLVLITMQKLASSSVAAVRQALRKRLAQLRAAARDVAHATQQFQQLREVLDEDDPSNLDRLAAAEERLLDVIDANIKLNPEEIPALEDLIASADAITTETKIQRIIELVHTTYAERAILFFTEYKATQALLLSALFAHFGDDCATFINGDGALDGVRLASGTTIRLTQARQSAATAFNTGKTRFLVSTEAAGEGIDLQHQCHTLIHVDLPWNPMRLHQRVGRISRYGQKMPVDVLTVRNPDTVESHIWDCLDRKLERITLAFQGGMDDPEDMRQLVVGMASQHLFTQLFADADPSLSPEKLQTWFDANSNTFGGEEAVQLVKSLFGHVAHFDFGKVAAHIPKVELGDLMPFFKVLFAALNRRPTLLSDARMAFKTPVEWRTSIAVGDSYQLLFDREAAPQDGEDVAGVGLRVVEVALSHAAASPAAIAVLGELAHPMVLFAIRDRVTTSGGTVRKVVVAMQQHGESWTLLRDWEVIRLLNPIADKPRSAAFDGAPCPTTTDIAQRIAAARGSLEEQLAGLDLPFQRPTIEDLACLLPG